MPKHKDRLFTATKTYCHVRQASGSEGRVHTEHVLRGGQAGLMTLRRKNTGAVVVCVAAHIDATDQCVTGCVEPFSHW